MHSHCIDMQKDESAENYMQIREYTRITGG